jgi:peptidyl-dipeptidase Dcp
MSKTIVVLTAAWALSWAAPAAHSASRKPFGPSNPFFAPSQLPFQAPPFDKIRDGDYQPAIEAGMAQQRAEIRAIADNPATPTFENTLVAMEKSGLLLARTIAPFEAVVGANTNPQLQAAKTVLAPKLAAHADAIYLNAKLFARVAAVYGERSSARFDPEARRLIELTYDQFVHAGAKLSTADKAKLRRLNEQASTLTDTFESKLLEATKQAGLHTDDPAVLSGFSQSELAAAGEAARGRGLAGYVLPLQNTTQQPALSSLKERSTRQAIFHNSWNRAERGDANDTRNTIARLAQLRAVRAGVLGYPNYAAWVLEDQMAKTPAEALKFMDALAPAATAKAAMEGADIQSLIDAQHGGFTLEPWDWEYYAEQTRRAKYDLDEAQVRPYFELNRVLTDGVFYAANLLYGITFSERHDVPVYQSDVRVFEVRDADGAPLALLYIDYFKRDNKNGGAWMSNLVNESKLLGTLPVIYNVANLPKPAPGEPALLSFDDVTTMFHEFGHALHGMLADTRYPSLSGTATPRDFVEFPSQFNEHWAVYPSILEHYARHDKTGEAMPQELIEKIKKAENSNEGYALTETLAAAELDMQWHVLPPDAPLEDPDRFETEALARTHLDVHAVPPRYRSSYFSHIWGNDYAAGYYAYLWTQMLDDDAFEWFEEHGGPTRANGERFRRMVLSRGNTEDLAALYAAWRGRPPTIDAMLKYRGLPTAR